MIDNNQPIIGRYISPPSIYLTPLLPYLFNTCIPSIEPLKKIIIKICLNILNSTNKYIICLLIVGGVY